MGKFLFTLMLGIFSIRSYSQPQIALCTYYDGYWGNWERYYIQTYGNYGGIIFVPHGDHPSDWMWKFTIDNYHSPSKEEIRYHYKYNKWYEYTGVFEYYISDEYQSLRQMFKDGYHNPIISPKNHRVEKGERPCKKVCVAVTIKIAPYKKHPKVYNIFFRDCAFGIDLCDNYWE